jgi:hypothetical protein
MLVCFIGVSKFRLYLNVVVLDILLFKGVSKFRLYLNVVVLDILLFYRRK